MYIQLGYSTEPGQAISFLPILTVPLCASISFGVRALVTIKKVELNDRIAVCALTNTAMFGALFAFSFGACYSHDKSKKKKQTQKTD